MLGNVGMAHYTFLGIGFWLILVAGIAFALVYAVGPTRGKRAAKLWVRLCVAIAVIGVLADVGWAVIGGEMRRFISVYGAAPLLEMTVLALLFLGTMWLMAIRYTDGLKD